MSAPLASYPERASSPTCSVRAHATLEEGGQRTADRAALGTVRPLVRAHVMDTAVEAFLA
jgi:hypothetical protein